MPLHQDSPTVLSVIDGMTKKRRALVMRLREIVLSLGGVEERTLYDHFCREWTPAFYTRGTQLCHVHDFGADLRATMFVGMKTLEPFIMASDGLSLENHRMVAETPAPRNTKELRMPITSMKDVDEFVALVRVKWEFVHRAGV
ncbi:MAG: hypothetical protein FI707_05495 [SAR202 cluster bacterium]|nr:hypothetical protein [Chloroflexota bacterium]MDP6420143.1 hypothetical protein [SAR202 cluster bacterium]HAL49464.1 hypothetical protein [Dehalococcoidia bacterium]MDP6662543.1 hypothetical protein [SAR202 cluster bacterium]MQG56894.1 hypothetical protein [SAR202 cluster bacterium]